jgi:dUTP pyrophosphatase
VATSSRISVTVELTARHAKLPARQSPGAAGYDLHALVPRGQRVLKPKEWATFRTGLALKLPSGCEAQIRPRSGLAADHGVTILNSPATIDSDYRGELKIILVNLGRRAVIVHDGDRIGQIVFARTQPVRIRSGHVRLTTQRGSKGLGHTGRA